MEERNVGIFVQNVCGSPINIFADIGQLQAKATADIADVMSTLSACATLKSEQKRCQHTHDVGRVRSVRAQYVRRLLRSPRALVCIRLSALFGGAKCAAVWKLLGIIINDSSSNGSSNGSI